jgi:hypothetical protein
MNHYKCSLALALAAAGLAYAGEGGISVYPAGAETVMSGHLPGPGSTMLEEFTDFYFANQLAGPRGGQLVPGFHLRVGAVAFKVVHNWGIRVAGGTLSSSVALPFEDIHLTAPFGRQNKAGFGNGDIETTVAYSKGALHWWYGYEGYTPGFGYTKNALVNIGQHYFASAPAAAFTYLPNRAKEELSSKVQYIVNYHDRATNYRSGSELIWEYAAMHRVRRNIAVGVQGYLFDQTTDDLQNGAIFEGGNRGRNLAIGPQVRWHAGSYSLIMKYQKDFLTENRPAGNAIWFQFGRPLGHRAE